MAETVYRETVHFSGRVQGVGFRYATLQVAKEYEVTGEVKNLADGRVFLCAEGAPAEVRAFCQEVEDRLRPFIRETEIASDSVQSQYRGFAITH